MTNTLFAFGSDGRMPRQDEKQKKVHHCAEMMLQVRDKNGKLVPAKGFLDTGTSEITVLSKFVKKDITVVLGGLGGDELMGGYDIHKFIKSHA